MPQTLQKFLHFAQQKLSEIYAEQEARSLARMLLCEVLNISKSELYGNGEKPLTAPEVERLADALAALEEGKPIQYVLGKTEFYGLPFAVNESVLIPRRETEELVDWVVSSLKAQGLKHGLQMLDVGTGSGCIAVALAKNLPQAQLTAYDISEKALALARANAQKNGVNVAFEQVDILSCRQPSVSLMLDAIVSNPPYVCESEKAEMHRNVLRYEPPLALFVEDSDPLVFYRAVADFALPNLREKGLLFFEVNRKFGLQVVELLQHKGFVSVELRNDISGNPRMIRAQHA